ncbi:hypothetical protein D3C85_1545810 [compost metagenome]
MIYTLVLSREKEDASAVKINNKNILFISYFMMVTKNSLPVYTRQAINQPKLNYLIHLISPIPFSFSVLFEIVKSPFETSLNSGFRLVPELSTFTLLDAVDVKFAALW